ncbi:lytic transglycosylase domain-containing protein [Tuberibacillus sp. Marseille-P3662]|uniref:lytic transglycosylase domain-containing protein n=1 Tax=Tuberibacillus sp. Marseille-P3662 TaxID=1965358 RepID=UPI0026E3D05B|nr:lytic transglycosylase domain-containing protein [Tuberibacillus sp. Marseille-P3662]
MNISSIREMMMARAIHRLSSTSGYSQTPTSTPTSGLFANILRSYLTIKQSSNENKPTISEPFDRSLIPFQTRSVPETNGSNSEYDNIIRKASAQYGVNEQLIRSVVQQESGFNPLSQSKAGAAGLMQLMPATAQSLGVTNRLDPEQNINGGTKYLKQMLDRFNGNKVLALAAYNAGPGNVEKYNGVPPFSETQNYVKQILETYYS